VAFAEQASERARDLSGGVCKQESEVMRNNNARGPVSKLVICSPRLFAALIYCTLLSAIAVGRFAFVMKTIK